MKNRMNSKRTIIGLAIATGLLATFMALPVSAAGPDLNPVEASRAVTTGVVIDESQEAGNYPVSKVTLARELPFDESQEAGNYPVSKLTAPQAMIFDESQEVGGL